MKCLCVCAFCTKARVQSILKGRNLTMKKLAALVLAVAMIMSIMMIPASAEVTKPQKITIFIDGTVVTQPNGQAEFKARWE